MRIADLQPDYGGSSPRVRGTLHRFAAGVVILRFIPACAGNAPSQAAKCSSTTVHPRVCGERSLRYWPMIVSIGSSPRVRGTQWRLLPTLPNSRFIPACAGNAQRSSRRCSAGSVHPRVCGERVMASTIMCAGFGSSPRVRGTLAGLRAHPVVSRFIPACAGNARGWQHRRGQPSVHPRVCGERFVGVPLNASILGSSPRVRGTPIPQRHRFSQRRFIPACAGNARIGRCPGPDRPVHPRVCGERPRGSPVSGSVYGSSPRVRGTR